MEVSQQPQTVLVFRLDVEDLVADLHNIPKFFFFQEPIRTPTATPPAEIHVPLDSAALWDRLQAITSANDAQQSTIWSSLRSGFCLLKDRLYYLNALAALSASLLQKATQNTLPNLPEQAKTEFELKAREYIENDQIVLCPEGVGGTYFIQDPDGEKIGIFKPVDEEPGAANNPKKLVDTPLLPAGGGAIREVAAFALDHGFAGVPPTYLVEDVPTRFGPKTGSIQQFIPNDGESSSVGYSSFITEDVHRIGILDIRLFNMDRNGENILISRQGDQHHLIPIDHSYILPPHLNGAYYEWMYWPQAKRPFSQETLDFLNKIDPLADAELLRGLGIPESNIKTMVVTTVLLQHCASIGKTLFEIASMMCRDLSQAPSRLENLVETAFPNSMEELDVASVYAFFRSLVAKEIK
jgi:hypothetical protein